MLDLKFIRQNPDLVQKAIADKHLDLNLQELLDLDKKVLAARQEMEEHLQKRNTLSAQMKDADAATKERIRAESKTAGEKAAQINENLKVWEEDLKQLLYKTPTIPSADTPIGADDTENVVLYQKGTKPVFDFTPLGQMELLQKNDWAEFDRITKTAGTRALALKGELAMYEVAIHLFVMNFLANKGFTLLSVPCLTNEAALIGTGHFPGDRDSVYKLPEDNQYLIGTAEVALNSLYAGEMLKEEDLPIKLAGYSPCFRREAGASGKDTRGMIRVHQFTKTEQYILCTDDLAESDKMHAFLLQNTEEILQAFELPYQVIACCTGDMGTGKHKMNDVECWVPSENKYRETHSCSSLLDWQARRTNLRYRGKDGKVHFCYTLNNTAIATPRALVALIENHQNADGTVNIPKALQPYMGGKTVLGKK